MSIREYAHHQLFGVHIEVRSPQRRVSVTRQTEAKPSVLRTTPTRSGYTRDRYRRTEIIAHAYTLLILSENVVNEEF